MTTDGTVAAGGEELGGDPPWEAGLGRIIAAFADLEFDVGGSGRWWPLDRRKDEGDFAGLLLDAALRRVHPGHPWIERVDGHGGA